MEYRKFFVKALYFGGTFLAAYFLLFAVLYKVNIGNASLLSRVSNYLGEKGRQHASESLYEYKSRLKTNEKFDFVVLGSSHAYRGYDPRIFQQNGFHIYNLGTSGQQIKDTYFLISTYLNKNITSKVIFDVYEGTFTDGVEGTFKLIRSYPDFAPAAKEAISLKDMRGINLLTFRFFTDYLLPPSNFDYHIQKQLDSSLYIGSGYISSTDSIKKPLVEDDAPLYLRNEEALAYFDKCLAYLHQMGIKTVLVSHPIPTYMRRKNHVEWVKDVKSIGDKYSVPFWDFSEYEGFSNTAHFHDSNHLNQAGVDKYNAILIDKLKTTNF